MKTFRLLAQLLALGSAGLLVSCSTTDSSRQSARQNALYLCNCGADCKCTTVSTKAGKCTCGHNLKPGHLLKVDGSTALLCMCEPGCKCAFDAKDPTKCGCGKPIRTASLKGTGIYFCNCGGSCTCNTVSDKPGQCHCGMQLKRVD